MKHQGSGTRWVNLAVLAVLGMLAAPLACAGKVEQSSGGHSDGMTYGDGVGMPYGMTYGDGVGVHYYAEGEIPIVQHGDGEYLPYGDGNGMRTEGSFFGSDGGGLSDGSFAGYSGDGAGISDDYGEGATDVDGQAYAEGAAQP